MAKVINITFLITEDDGETPALQKTWSIPVSNIAQFKHPTPLGVAFDRPANQFWDSCIMMGLVIKD